MHDSRVVSCIRPGETILLAHCWSIQSLLQHHICMVITAKCYSLAAILQLFCPAMQRVLLSSGTVPSTPGPVIPSVTRTIRLLSIFPFCKFVLRAAFAILQVVNGGDMLAIRDGVDLKVPPSSRVDTSYTSSSASATLERVGAERVGAGTQSTRSGPDQTTPLRTPAGSIVTSSVSGVVMCIDFQVGAAHKAATRRLICICKIVENTLRVAKMVNLLIYVNYDQVESACLRACIKSEF